MSRAFFFFLGDVNLQPICSKVLSAAEIQQFKNAIKDRYWFQLFMGNGLFFSLSVTRSFCFTSLCWLTHTTKDDLPIWGMVGEYDAGQRQIQAVHSQSVRDSLQQRSHHKSSFFALHCYRFDCFFVIDSVRCCRLAVKVTLAGETPVELTGDSAEITVRFCASSSRDARYSTLTAAVCSSTYSVHWVPTSGQIRGTI
jgi:hypothetical protein